MAAVDDIAIPATIEQEHGLAFGFDCRAEEVSEALGEQVNAATEGAFGFHVDEFDVGEG